MNIFKRYVVNFDKFVNQIPPPYVKDRKAILLLQSILYPLQQTANKFKDWAIETSVEAAMTSQVFYFEWFLNQKFSKYFKNNSDYISILGGTYIGNPVYYVKTNMEGKQHFLTCKQGEDIANELKPLYKMHENQGDLSVSFIVYVPSDTKIPSREFINMEEHWVDRYKKKKKTYSIQLVGKEK